MLHPTMNKEQIAATVASVKAGFDGSALAAGTADCIARHDFAFLDMDQTRQALWRMLGPDEKRELHDLIESALSDAEASLDSEPIDLFPDLVTRQLFMRERATLRTMAGYVADHARSWTN